MESNKTNKAFHPIRDWRQRKRKFLIPDIIFSIITVVIVFVSLYSGQKILLSIALIFLGLTFFNRGLEYEQQGEKTFYKVNSFIGVFLIILGILSFWLN
ncbi:hypothetical protein RJD24_11325 [Bacillaceae bacterium IKA-2]|nr:hypothetical protein RJD24_11325 [Bacillaceae bacterium IKA-2]